MINNGIAHRDYASSATVQVELFKDRLTVFSPGPMHRDMKYELLSEDHQSYATNPIIAHALFYVKYIEELGSGTVDMFDLCRATGLRPPIFDIDARHFTVTVYRPKFDEQGNRIPATVEEVRVKAAEVSTKTAEVSTKPQGVGPYPEQIGPKAQEVGPYPEQIGRKKPEVGVENPKVGVESPQVGVESPEVGVEIDFDTLLVANRKDFRITCRVIWQTLEANPNLTQMELATALKMPASSVQSACTALKEVGLLKREGARKNGKWITCKVSKR